MLTFLTAAVAATTSAITATQVGSIMAATGTAMIAVGKYVDQKKHNDEHNTEE